MVVTGPSPFRHFSNFKSKPETNKKALLLIAGNCSAEPPALTTQKHLTDKTFRTPVLGTAPVLSTCPARGRGHATRSQLESVCGDRDCTLHRVGGLQAKISLTPQGLSWDPRHSVLAIAPFFLNRVHCSAPLK